jgi:hypothetical protein
VSLWGRGLAHDHGSLVAPKLQCHGGGGQVQHPFSLANKRRAAWLRGCVWSSVVAAACFDATYRRLLTGTQAGDCLDVWNFSNGAHLGTLSKSHVSNIGGCTWGVAVTAFAQTVTRGEVYLGLANPVFGTCMPQLSQ